MNKIEKLIQELCPNGVEFKTLGEVFKTRNGYTPSKAEKKYWINGTVPWFRMDDIRKNGHVLSDSIQHVTEIAVKGGRLFPANSIVMATTATIGEHALITVPYLANQQFTILMLQESYEKLFNIKFVFYYCFLIGKSCHKITNSSTFASVDMGRFKKLKIPIPPLKIQQEIVNVLDVFTGLIDNLSRELPMRKEQYAYYRDKLLTFPTRENQETEIFPYLQRILDKHAVKEVEFKTLGEVCEIKTGQSVSKLEISKNIGLFPVINSGKEPLGFINKWNTENDPVGITTRGANVGFVTWSEGKFFRGSLNYSCTIKNKFQVLNRYLYFLLSTLQKNIRDLCNYGAIPALNRSELTKLKIPVPPLAVQAEIVEILDKFEALTSELVGGIPHEIKLRKQQYEYYRNKLLTFEELKVGGSRLF